MVGVILAALLTAALPASVAHDPTDGPGNRYNYWQCHNTHSHADEVHDWRAGGSGVVISDEDTQTLVRAGNTAPLTVQDGAGDNEYECGISAVFLRANHHSNRGVCVSSAGTPVLFTVARNDPNVGSPLLTDTDPFDVFDGPYPTGNLDPSGLGYWGCSDGSKIQCEFNCQHFDVPGGGPPCSETMADDACDGSALPLDPTPRLSGWWVVIETGLDSDISHEARASASAPVGGHVCNSQSGQPPSSCRWNGNSHAGPQVSNPAWGVIKLQHSTVTGRTFQPTGVFALWDCEDDYAPGLSYEVTCTWPGRPDVSAFDCSIMIMYVQTLVGGKVRGNMECEDSSGGSSQMQTPPLGENTFGRGFGLGPTDAVRVTCRATAGQNGLFQPTWLMGCGEP